MIGTLGWAAVRFIPAIEDTYLRVAAWVIYGFVQGLICTGLWILGHEAGHGAFSKYSLLNDVVGFFTHSSLMVPYYSWKFSHHRHHMFTGHMEKDMAFVPKKQSDYEQRQPLFDMEYLEDTPVYQAITLIFHQLFAWVFYLFFNISAGSASQQKPTSSLFNRSHFDPTSAVFRRSEAPFIVLSDIGLLMTFSALYWLSGVVGTSTVVLLYLQPYVWVHHWLSKLHPPHLFMFLHFRFSANSCPKSPSPTSTTLTLMFPISRLSTGPLSRVPWPLLIVILVSSAVICSTASLSTMSFTIYSREYLTITNLLAITCSYQILFSRIPFYYAEEATDALKPVLGELYHRDDRSFLGQLWSNFTQCKFVAADESVPGALKWVQKSK